MRQVYFITYFTLPLKFEKMITLDSLGSFDSASNKTLWNEVYIATQRTK